MSPFVRRLAHGLILIMILLSAAMPVLAADEKITLRYSAPASPGDVVTLKGKQRFNSGQLRNVRFFIAGGDVAARVISTDQVELIVPDLDTGTYPVKVVKHDLNPGKDIVLFEGSIDVVSDVEVVLATVSGTIGAGPGELNLPGVATIEALEDPTARTAGEYTIEQVRSGADSAIFKSLLLGAPNNITKNLPALVQGEFIRVSTTATVNGFLAVRMAVDPQFLASVPAGYVPEIYARVFDVGGDGEIMTDEQGLDASYDAATGELVAPLPGMMFTTLEERDPAASAIHRGAATNAITVKKVVLQVSVKSANATVCFQGVVNFPTSLTPEATPRDVLPMKASLTFTVPERLRNPTAYNPPFIVGGSFGGGHKGVDLKTDDGDPVYAATDGTVSSVFFHKSNKKSWIGGNQSGGWTVVINSVDGRRTGYAHLQTGSILVQQGDSVFPGMKIANGDSTGNITGPHLHLTYTICDTKINPFPFVQPSGPTAVDFYDEFYVVTVVNGNVITSSKRNVADFVFTNGKMDYSAPVDLGKLTLTPGSTVPLQIRVVAKTSGKTTTIYDGKLKIKEVALRVRLEWNTAGSDVDLHVTDSLGRHAYYAAKTAIPGGVLDYDDVDGFGPETFTLNTMAAGVTYTVAVHYYSDHGTGPTTATVKVFLNGVLKDTFTTPLTNNQFVNLKTY